MIWIIIIISYLLSAAYNWWWIHIAHSEKGRWSSLTPGIVEVLIVFIPLFNIVFCIMTLFTSPYEHKPFKINYNKFFNIKKKK